MADLISISNFVLFLFILTYALIVLFYRKKTYIIWGAIIILILIGLMSPLEALQAVNWNVIGIYIGMLFISELFIYSRLPDMLAERIVSKSSKVWIAMLGVCLLSGIMSAVVENVAVVLIIAPIALLIAKKLKINPIPLIIGIAVSSNLQGVATMIGDPPSLLLAYYANLNFNDFFVFQGKASLFFAVQIAAIASLIVLYFIFRNYKQKTQKIKFKEVKTIFPGVIIIVMVMLLAVTSLFRYHGASKFLILLDMNKAGIICVLCGLTLLLWYKSQERHDVWPMLKRLDWDTCLFLIGIFIMVESLVKVNFMTTFASFISSLTGSNVFLAYNLIVWVSVFFSGFVDNVPFIAAMLPVVGNLAQFMDVSPYLFYFGLVIGASVGGNVTPVGAAANIVGMGILRKNGFNPTFWDFVKIGIPFTIVSVLAAGIYIWFVFQ